MIVVSPSPNIWRLHMSRQGKQGCPHPHSMSRRSWKTFSELGHPTVRLCIYAAGSHAVREGAASAPSSAECPPCRARACWQPVRNLRGTQGTAQGRGPCRPQGAAQGRGPCRPREAGQRTDMRGVRVQVRVSLARSKHSCPHMSGRSKQGCPRAKVCPPKSFLSNTCMFI